VRPFTSKGEAALTHSARTFFRFLTAAAMISFVAACSDASGPLGPEADDPLLQLGVHASEGFTVYSQNLYLGGDTGPIFTLDFTNVPQVLAATQEFWAEVLASDPESRAAAMMEQIAARRPHLVGLQEAMQFRVVDFSTGTPEVTSVVDFLAAIQAEIDERAYPYEIVAVQENTSTGSSSGLPLAVDPAAGTVVQILQFTDRIAVLRRTDVTLDAVAQGGYAASFPVGPLDVTRGWIRVSTEHRGVPQHFITTHLEVQALAPVQVAQTQELLASVMAGLEGVTILAGDLNSDAAADSGSPSWTPTYGMLIDAGFTDAWKQSGQPAKTSGFTCCQAKDLLNEASALDERIDFVLVRKSGNPARSGFVPGSMSFEILGNEPDDRLDSGLWPSDHAGILAGLKLAPLVASGSGR
jgi:endonuclease/exonuclease/phosphatase family metal-dependent hydrolase